MAPPFGWLCPEFGGHSAIQGLLGGVLRNTAATPETPPPQDSEEICCNTCSATRVARRGVPAHVCDYVKIPLCNVALGESLA